MYAVYIIYSESIDRFYIGSTSSLADRIYKHNNIHHGFTAAGKPWKLMYSESFHSKAEALIREKQLKSWKNKSRLQALIKKSSEHPDYQSGGS
jgi:putative endonuclease